MKNVHFAIPEIYGDSLSYYELLRKLVDKVNDLIDNYNTVPEQIAEAVKLHSDLSKEQCEERAKEMLKIRGIDKLEKIKNNFNLLYSLAGIINK